MGWMQIPESLGRGYARRPVRLAINLLLAMLLLAFLGSYVRRDWRTIPGAEIALDLPALLFALILYGVNYLLFVAAWQRLVLYSGGTTEWQRNALMYSYSYLARLLPTPFWQHASRIHLYAQTGMDKRSALKMTALETILQVLAGMAFYSLIAIQSLLSEIVLLAIGLAAALAFALRHRLPKVTFLHNIGQAGSDLRVRDLALWSVLYLVTWIIAGPFLHFALAAFSGLTPPSMLDLWRIWTLSSLVAYIGAYTLGGGGILREFTMIWLLTPSYSPPVALLMTVGVRLLMTLAGVFWPLVTAGILSLSSPRTQILIGKAPNQKTD